MPSRLPRFKRVSPIAPIQLSKRDHAIIRLFHRYRFLRSNQIIALLDGSPQQISRRLQLLFHHGYLERPRAQLQYYERGGSKSIAYGLGNKGGTLLRRELGVAVRPVAWGEKNRAVGRSYLEHALLVSEIMVSLELACRQKDIRLVYDDELPRLSERQTFRWRVKLENGLTLGLIPDRVFALDYRAATGQQEHVICFLEADRGTMPVARRQLSQTSMLRKFITYATAWTQGILQQDFGAHRFRVLTVTSGAARLESLLQSCAELKSGHGLFLLAERMVLANDLFAPVWRSGKSGAWSSLLELPPPATIAV